MASVAFFSRSRMFDLDRFGFSLLRSSDFFTASYDLELHLYQNNWWIWSLIGRRDAVVLFPLLAWLPTVALGFLLAHLVLTYKNSSLFENNNIEWALQLSLILFSIPVFIYWQTPQHTSQLNSLWDITAMQRATFLGESLKFFFFCFCFLFLFKLNQSWSLRSLDLFFYKYSIASFYIYLVTTTWSIYIAHQLPQSWGFACNFLIVLLSTLIISEGVAQLGYLLHHKRFRLILRKAT